MKIQMKCSISSSVSTLFVMEKRSPDKKGPLLASPQVTFHIFKLGKHKKSCLKPQTSNWQPRNLIFGMQNHLVDLYQVCSNYGPEAKNSPLLESQVLCKFFHKKNLNQTTSPRVYLFGM